MYQRIISLAPSNTEIIYALGAQDRLIACTRYCDFPQGAEKKPKIGGWLDINDELVKKLEPDLILTSTFVQDKIARRYKNSGMNIAPLMPSTLNGIFDSITVIGDMVEKKTEAEKLVASMKNEIQKIKSKMKTKPKPRVYIEEWHKPPHVSGNWISEMVQIAGGRYGLIKPGEYSKEVSTEQIQKYNPEIIIVSICGLGRNAKKEWITKRDGWQEIAAVKSGKVFVIDDSLLNRPGPRLIEGLKEISRIINQG